MTDTSTWSRGYPVHETYPASWHSFQSPAHLHAICALMGVAWEVDAQSPLSILEVGCGTGYTSQMLAAGNPHWQVLGLDYNPAHVAEGRSVAAAAGLANLRYLEADLAELSDAEIDRLPEFDLVTVHGFWSWVADPVREAVLRVLRRRLKAGGVALVSYNALPGAGGALGLARLVRNALLQAGNSEQGTALAVRQVRELIAAEPSHLPPSSWRRLLTGEVKGARTGYLLHEFETAHWRPSFHSDVAAALGSARCDYVGSASIDENFPAMSLTPAQQALWNDAPDAGARELLFDLCVQRAFRRDVYVRGLRRVPTGPAIDALQFAAANRAEGPVVLKAQAGEAQLPEPLVQAIRAALAEGPQTIGALRRQPGCEKVTPAELVAMLIGSGWAVPLWRQPGSGADWDQAHAAAHRLNHVAAQRLAPHGIGGGSLGLASPCLAGGLPCTPLELGVVRVLTLPGADPGLAGNPAALARQLAPQDPQPVPEVMAELEKVLAQILRERYPAWQQLAIV